MIQIIDTIKKRKALSLLIFILLFLVMTNPSMTTFKNYLGYSSYEGLKKERNFFIFSVFRYKFSEPKKPYLPYGRDHVPVAPRNEVYIGIAGNFFEL